MDFMEAFAKCKPLYEAACEHLTPAHAMKVTAYAVTYRWMTDHLGREPTAQEHAEALDASRAQYYRYRSMFRQAFGVERPTELPADFAPAVPTLSLGLAYST